MTCEEFLEQAPAYALSILEQDERNACARHLGEVGPHRGCTGAVEEARQTAAALSGALPGRRPSPQLWGAIEARLTGDLPRDRRARRRVWRELAGWFVAAAVIGLYLYGPPLDTRRGAVAVEGAPAIIRSAMALMTLPGSRLLAFSPWRENAGRATLIMSAGEQRAMVLCDRTPPAAARRLRLWSARGQGRPVPLALLSLSNEGVASVALGKELFEPGLPDRLLISADGPDAKSPTEILLSAELK
jgi:anti-sigma-K factor RskA